MRDGPWGHAVTVRDVRHYSSTTAAAATSSVVAASRVIEKSPKTHQKHSQFIYLAQFSPESKCYYTATMAMNSNPETEIVNWVLYTRNSFQRNENGGER